MEKTDKGEKGSPTLQRKKTEDTDKGPKKVKKSERERLILEYGAVIQRETPDAREVAEAFLEIVKTALETMGYEPKTACIMLHAITKFSNEFYWIYREPDMLELLQKKIKWLKVNEYPLATEPNDTDHLALLKL